MCEISFIIKSWETEKTEKIKQQMNALTGYVKDEQWLQTLTFDYCINPRLAEWVCQQIEKINALDKQTELSQNGHTDFKRGYTRALGRIISNARKLCRQKMNQAEAYKDPSIKWYGYRHAYAIYAFLECVIEASGTTIAFRNILQENEQHYLEELQRLDSILTPESLEKYWEKVMKGEEDEEEEFCKEWEKMYVLLKYWQDNQHVFHNTVLAPQFHQARNEFEKKVKESGFHAFTASNQLLILYLLDKVQNVSAAVLNRMYWFGFLDELEPVLGEERIQRFKQQSAIDSTNERKEIPLHCNAESNLVVGRAASSGEVRGILCYMEEPEEYEFKKGDILLAEFTDPEWYNVMLNASGVITSQGGILSHAAIICRELGIPCVTGIGENGLKRLKQARWVNMNGTTGKIEIETRI